MVPNLNYSARYATVEGLSKNISQLEMNNAIRNEKMEQLAVRSSLLGQENATLKESLNKVTERRKSNGN